MTMDYGVQVLVGLGNGTMLVNPDIYDVDYGVYVESSSTTITGGQYIGLQRMLA